jgi:hypothetical protein
MWQNDMLHGKGRLVYHTGDYYEGDWVMNKAEGYGKYS